MVDDATVVSFAMSAKVNVPSPVSSVVTAPTIFLSAATVIIESSPSKFTAAVTSSLNAVVPTPLTYKFVALTVPLKATVSVFPPESAVAVAVTVDANTLPARVAVASASLSVSVTVTLTAFSASSLVPIVELATVAVPDVSASKVKIPSVLPPMPADVADVTAPVIILPSATVMVPVLPEPDPSTTAPVKLPSALNVPVPSAVIVSAYTSELKVAISEVPPVSNALISAPLAPICPDTVVVPDKDKVPKSSVPAVTTPVIFTSSSTVAVWSVINIIAVDAFGSVVIVAFAPLIELVADNAFPLHVIVPATAKASKLFFIDGIVVVICNSLLFIFIFSSFCKKKMV